MLLTGKTAIVHGGSGAVGAAVARAFAREGAAVHLTGRTVPPLEEVARRIRGDGGIAHVARLDATDRAAVDRHAEAVAAAGDGTGIDICFNATSDDDLQGSPLLDLAVADVLRPVTKAVTTTLTTATAAARHMIDRGGGVLLVLAGGRETIPGLGGSHIAWSALTGVCRQLAAELGPHGVRVAWLLSPGSPAPGAENRADEGALLTERPGYDDVANAAVFAASDWARTMTATELNLTGGLVPD
ncbi:SDR family oxidoreductase [Streptomyces sp. LP05-1]|uniref:SDR family oxidoreductase n=1 Tax=Streptomyces pyxinae TaxID=2970734 RepID=A0ABT2CHG2_9ACTN|nr:SDR family oxidoreductase [Streptomyces sp. LP05-1]MCS0636151.1 SDR family oxidoreductase [Streptomyces sp. LP05-1]